MDMEGDPAMDGEMNGAMDPVDMDGEMEAEMDMGDMDGMDMDMGMGMEGVAEMSGMEPMEGASAVDPDDVEAELPEQDFSSDPRLAELKEKLNELDNYKPDQHWEDRFYQYMHEFITDETKK
jgi:hypothetical protein